MNSREFGAMGEDLAARHAESLGWRIVGRNVRVGRGELDIIASDGDELVIIEVRTRRIGKISPAETTAGPLKMERTLRAARTYIENVLEYDGNWRVDIAAVTVGWDGYAGVEMFSDVTA